MRFLSLLLFVTYIEIVFFWGGPGKICKCKSFLVYKLILGIIIMDVVKADTNTRAIFVLIIIIRIIIIM